MKEDNARGVFLSPENRQVRNQCQTYVLPSGSVWFDRGHGTNLVGATIQFDAGAVDWIPPLGDRKLCSFSTGLTAQKDKMGKW